MSSSTLLPSPRLPLELLTHILSLAFLPSSSHPLLSPPPPPPTHLLLVSHAVHSLCLPFLYRIITLSRPSHWLTFFGRQSGLFVSGPEATTRWGWVQEMHVCLATAKVPVKEGGWVMEDEDEDVLAKLRVPGWRQLPVLAFVKAAETHTLGNGKEDEANDLDLERATLCSPLGLIQLKHVLKTQHGSLASLPGFLDGEVSVAIKIACLFSRITFFATTLLPRLSPHTITGSLALFRSLRLSKVSQNPLGYTDEYGNAGPVVSLVRDEETDEVERVEYEGFWNAQRMLSGTEMRLVGFDAKTREGLRMWWMERRERRRKYGGTGLGGEAEETGSWGWLDEESGEVVVIRPEDRV